VFTKLSSSSLITNFENPIRKKKKERKKERKEKKRKEKKLTLILFTKLKSDYVLNFK